MKKAVITLTTAAFLLGFTACKDTKKAREEAEAEEMVRQIDSLEQEIDEMNAELDALLKEAEEIEVDFNQ